MTGVVRHAMDTDGQRLAALLIAAGPVLLIVAGIVTPSGLYQEPDDAIRIAIIDSQWAMFVAAQVLWSLWLVVPTIGFVLLSRHLTSAIAWLPNVAALSVAAGAIAGVLFVALQTADPQRYWLDGEGAWASMVGAWLIIAAAILYGLAMINARGWAVAAYVLVGYGVVGAVAMLLSAPAFYITAGFSLAALAPAVALWSGSPRVGSRDTSEEVSMEISGRTHIARPVAEVFQSWETLERSPEYSPAALARRKLTDGPVGKGTRYHAIDRWPGRTVEFTVEITEYDAPRWMAASWSEPMEGGWDARFEAVGEGTDIEFRSVIRPSGLMGLATPLLRPWAKRQLASFLASFKEWVETGKGRAPTPTAGWRSTAPSDHGSRRP
jgi:hypothetical protein